MWITSLGLRGSNKWIFHEVYLFKYGYARICSGLASRVNEQSITWINIWSRLHFSRYADLSDATATRERDVERRRANGCCQCAITNSGGGRNAATLYARRRILHSVFSGTMGRGVRVLKYEYEYGRLHASPNRAHRRRRPCERRSMSACRPRLSLCGMIFPRVVPRPSDKTEDWLSWPNPDLGVVAGNCRVSLRNAARVLHSTSLTYNFGYM